MYGYAYFGVMFKDVSGVILMGLFKSMFGGTLTGIFRECLRVF